MKIKLTFTDEHIALIKALNFTNINFDDIIKSFEQYNKHVYFVEDPELLHMDIERFGPKDALKQNLQDVDLGDIISQYNISIDSVYGIDNYNLFGGTYLWEQMAYILGIHDHVISGTEEDPSGPKYPEEDMEHMRDLDAFIVSNLQNIFEILIQFCTEGIQAGVTYWCYDHQKIWYKEEKK